MLSASTIVKAVACLSLFVFGHAGSDAGSASNSRRTSTPSEITFTFGISLSFQHSCINDITACVPARRVPENESTTCYQCRDALAGISYWKSVINGGVYRLKNGDRIIVDIVVKDDYGNNETMRANYEELATWTSNSSSMFALFGPSFREWNFAAAEIANRHNKLFFMWAYDNFIYQTYPFPQTADDTWVAIQLADGIIQDLQAISSTTTSTVNASNSTTPPPPPPPPSRRVAESSDSSSVNLYEDTSDDIMMEACGDASCRTSDTIKGFDYNSYSDGEQRDNGAWQPGVIYQKSPNERTLQVSEPEFSGAPCTSDRYMAYPAYLLCPETSGVIGGDSTELDLSAYTELEALGIPIGTSDLITSSERTSGEWRVRIFDVTNNRCIAGLGNDPACRIKNPQQSTQNLDYPHAYEGMDFSWTALAPTTYRFAVSSTTPTTVEILVIYTDITTTSSSPTVRLSWQHGSITPCPLNMIGCAPCANWTACTDTTGGRYPVCNGTQSVSCADEPNPDGEVWEYGYENIFDINYARTSWAKDALDQLYEQGHTDFVFIYYSSEFTGDGETYKRQCQTLALYAASFNDTSVLLYYIQSRSTMTNDLRFLKLVGEDESFIVCGGYQSAVSFAMSARAFRIRALTVVVDRPLGYPFIQTIHGQTANYFLEPMTMKYNTSQRCEVFQTFQSFEDTFKSSRFFIGTHVSYATMQTVATGVVLIEAMQRVSSVELASTSAMSTWLKQNTFATFFGDIDFTFQGARAGRGASTRQYVPVTATATDGVKEYDLSDINIVSFELAPNYGYSYLQPFRGWIDKQLQVYPCDEGCQFEDNQCVACAIGYYRGTEEVECRPCPSGKFANAVGMSECEFCSTRGTCLTTEVIPSEYYFPVEDSYQAATTGVASPRQCVAPTRVLNSTSFQPCQPISVCVGGQNPCAGTNIGLLCGSCVDGESWYGPFQGRRRCAECSHKASVLFRFILSIAIIFLLTHLIANEALVAVTNPSSITCALLRTVLHLSHVLFFAIDSTRLNANTLMSMASMPLEMLVRPLEFSQLDCLYTDHTSKFAVKVYARGSILTMPLSIAGLAGLHLLAKLLKSAPFFAQLFLSCVASCCQRRQKAHDSKAKPDASAEDLIKELSLDDATIGKSAISDSSSDSKSGGETAKTGKEWSKLSGPGASFVSMHAGYDMQDHLRTFVRETIVLLIMIYPIVLAAGKSATACIEVAGTELGKLLSSHLDIACNSAEYKDLVGIAGPHYYIQLFGMPLLIIVYNLLSRQEFFSLEWRTMVSVLQCGYTPDMINWEALLILRTGIICEASRISDLSGRSVTMNLVLAVFMILQVRSRPYDKGDRQVLHRIDIAGSSFIIVTICMGAICQYELDSKFSSSGPPADSTRHTLVLVSVVMNLIILLWAVVSYTFNTIVQELNTVMCANTMHVDAGGKLLHHLIRKFYRGMNPIGYTHRNGRNFIDVSKLDEGEREFLGIVLSETMGACFDSGSDIQTWLLENAIHEGFQRAMEARQERLRSYYYKHGTLSYHLFQFFSLVKAFKIILRPPDIVIDEKNKKDGHSVQEILDGTHLNDEWSSGITVEELHSALSTVNVDVLEHHPNIRKRRTRKNPKKWFNEKANLDHEALVWNPGASLAWFEDYAKTWGSLVKNPDYNKVSTVEMLPLEAATKTAKPSDMAELGHSDDMANQLCQDMEEEFEKRRAYMRHHYDIHLSDANFCSPTCQRDMAEDEIEKIEEMKDKLEEEYHICSEEIMALKKQLSAPTTTGGGMGFQASLDIMRRCEEYEPIPAKASTILKMADTHGDQGTYLGQAHHDLANGIGKLVYDDHRFFIGLFDQGYMIEGALYETSGAPKQTLNNSSWTDVLQATIVDKYPLGEAFSAGDRIQVLCDMPSDNMQRVELPRGLLGMVKQIDTYGDALIRFDGISTRQWILRENLCKLDVQAPWKLEIFGAALKIDGEYELQGNYNDSPAWQKVGGDLWLLRNDEDYWCVKTAEQKELNYNGALLMAKEKTDGNNGLLPKDVPKHQWQFWNGEDWVDRACEVLTKAAQKWSIERALVKEDNKHGLGIKLEQSITRRASPRGSPRGPP